MSDALAAVNLQLSPADLTRIGSAIPAAAGERYDTHQMQMLDSEK